MFSQQVCTHVSVYGIFLHINNKTNYQHFVSAPMDQVKSPLSIAPSPGSPITVEETCSHSPMSLDLLQQVANTLPRLLLYLLTNGHQLEVGVYALNPS